MEIQFTIEAKMTFFPTKNDIYILRGIFFYKSHIKYLLKYKPELFMSI